MVIADHERRDLPPHEPIVVEPAPQGHPQAADFAEVTFRHTRPHWDLFVDEVVPGALLADMDAIGRISAAYEFSVLPESRFATYERPATFILGRQDPIVGYTDALALSGSYPRATYLVADGAGHNPHHEQPELSAVALGAWIDAVISSTA